MIADSNHICSFTDIHMVFEIFLIDILSHFVDLIPEMALSDKIWYKTILSYIWCIYKNSPGRVICRDENYFTDTYRSIDWFLICLSC